ncbi:MAG: hypothetical protein WBL63_22915, partial [Candidatus Acidiferrum sp.]
MSKELVISASSHERRVAILEEGQLVEIYIEREKEFALVGSIYKGKVTRVLPGMQSAFVDIGLDGDAFLYVSDVFENLEDYDHGHGDALPPVGPMNRAIVPPIEVLPGETLAVAGVREEVVHLDESHVHHVPTGDQVYGEVLHGVEMEGESHEGGQAEESSEGQEVSEVEERQPDSNASAPQNFAPSYNPTRSYPPRVGGERERGPGHDRGPGSDRGQGNDRGRGRRGRWGRRRGGSASGGGDRRPQGGRNLPPSKYASPQGERDSRGYDNRRPPSDRGPAAPAEPREDDIVLPGESLAKYRGRPQPPPAEPVREQEPEERQPNFEQPAVRPSFGTQPASGGPRRFSGSLPHWVLADNESEGGSAGGEGHAAEAAEQLSPVTEEHHEESHSEPQRNGAVGLSEEELAALSSSLVEAKHEETQAHAEADSLVGGADFDEEEAEEHHKEVHEEDAHEEESHLHAGPEAGEEQQEEEHEEHEEEQAGLSEAERADLAHDEALEHVETEAAMTAAASAEGVASEIVIEEDVILLPGETRSARDSSAPREEFVRRDSARIGSDPRSRFQRPQRGGRDRGGDRGRGR